MADPIIRTGIQWSMYFAASQACEPAITQLIGGSADVAETPVGAVGWHAPGHRPECSLRPRASRHLPQADLIGGARGSAAPR